MELSDVRAILGIDAVRHLVARPEGDPAWPRLEALRAEHHAPLDRIETHFRDLARLDERVRATVSGVMRNHVVVELQKVVSLIVHDHLQWDKTDERQRHEAAIREHPPWIEAVQGRDEAGGAARAHRATSEQTLPSSLRGHNLG